MDANNIRFRNLSFNGHRVEVSKLHDDRRLLLRDHRLPFPRHNRNHFAVDGRGDLRVIWIGARLFNLNARPLELRTLRGELGPPYGQCCFGVLRILTRGGICGEHLPLPPHIQFCLLQLRLRGALICGAVFRIQLRLLERVFLQSWINFGEPLPFFNGIAQLNMERLHLTVTLAPTSTCVKARKAPTACTVFSISARAAGALRYSGAFLLNAQRESAMSSATASATPIRILARLRAGALIFFIEDGARNGMRGRSKITMECTDRANCILELASTEEPNIEIAF